MKEATFRSISIMGGDGRVVAFIGSIGGEPVLQLFGRDGAVRASLAVVNHKGDEVSTLCLHDAEGHVQASFGIGPLGGERIIGKDGRPSRQSAADAS